MSAMTPGAAPDRPMATVTALLPRSLATPIRPAGPAGPGPAGPAGTRPERARGGARGPRRGERRVAGLVAGLQEFVALYAEVECGRRGHVQLVDMMTPALYAQLARRWVKGGVQAQVMSIRGVRTMPDRFDAVAILRRGDRWGALALSLQRSGGRWTVATAVCPEDGPLPPPPNLPAPDEEDDEQEYGDDILDGAIAAAAAVVAPAAAVL